MSAHYITEKGHCRVLGSTIEDGGVNFAIYCKAAKEMELLLFNDETDMSPDIIKLSAA
jgi:glycogen operon protein